jgi:hypothetical protein
LRGIESIEFTRFLLAQNNFPQPFFVSPIAMLVIILLATVESVFMENSKEHPVEALKYE